MGLSASCPVTDSSLMSLGTVTMTAVKYFSSKKLLSGRFFLSFPVALKLFQDRKNPDSETFRKLFVAGMRTQTTEETLHEYFEHWGEVVQCILVKDPVTQRSFCRCLSAFIVLLPFFGQ